jgi:hypothetical protein
LEENYENTFLQNIMNLKQIVDDNSKSLPIALGEGFYSFRLFCDAYFEKYKFPRLLFFHLSPSFAFSYIKKNLN